MMFVKHDRISSENRLSSRSRALRLTSHGAEAELALLIVVGGRATPLHAVPTTIRGAVCIVTSIVQVRELTEGAVGVASSSFHQRCRQSDSVVIQRAKGRGHMTC